MNENVLALLEDLCHCTSPREAEQAVACRHAAWLLRADDAEVTHLCSAWQRDVDVSAPAQQVFVAAVLQCLVQRQRAAGQPSALPSVLQEVIPRLYRQWRGSPARHQFIALLTTARGAVELSIAAELLAEDPPAESAQVAVAVSPLLQYHDYDPAPLFPRLLEALEHLSAAAAVLDLMNYWTRQSRLPVHPAGVRSEWLVRLLGELAQRLGQLEDAPPQRPREQTQQVAESLALTVSLRDALALIGDRRAVGKLHQVMRLKHRRLRVEAAAALTALGDDAGKENLVKWAPAEPVVRLHALNYADDLGLLDEVEPQYRTAAARGEAELALWLSQRERFGIAPSDMQLFDERLQSWPGFEEPVECQLFRFSYLLPHGEYSNLGIAGPCVFAFTADLSDLPPDDIYAAFAGWQAEHPEIYELPESNWSDRERSAASRLQGRLYQEGYEAVQPCLLGIFFGDQVLVATVRREDRSGTVVVDRDHILWHPQRASSHPLGPHEWYCIYKGRTLLRTFNP